MITTLLQGAVAAVAAPAAGSETAGVPLWKNMKGPYVNPGEGLSDDVDEAELVMFHTAYTLGVPALAYARLWGGFRVSSSLLVWAALGTGTGNTAADTDKGRLNGGDPIDGGATSFFHSERVRGLREMERIALEVGAFTGTWTLRAVLLSRGPVRG